MIVSFTVSNFRSFSSEETFSLIASNRLSDSHRDHTCSVPDSKENVLKTGVIYGANGAGKSNLFKALNYLKSIALKSKKKHSGTGREKFKFAAASNDSSVFDLLFVANNKLYRYGVKVDDHKIIEEWFVHIVGSKEKRLYERVTDEDGQVKIDASGLKSSGDKLRALATVGGPQNQSFLATIQATLDTIDFGEQISDVISWFDDSLTLIAPDSSFSSLGQLLDSDLDFLEFASNFLKSASTGVDHLLIQKNEITEEELRHLLGERYTAKLLDDILEDKDSVAVIPLNQDIELLVERTDENHFYRVTIQAAHKFQSGNVVSLDLTEESDGTRRLLNLLPALHFLRTSNAVFFIDEIDRSLHPKLAWEFLEFFLKSCQSGQHQIIVTTHESNLLDLDLLRRDEIWFAEKDPLGASHLYSLSDFKIRTDLDIRKHYLQGRFGAIPFLRNLTGLIENEAVT